MLSSVALQQYISFAVRLCSRVLTLTENDGERVRDSGQEPIVQESICLDTGSYLLNYAGCPNCSNKANVRIVNRQETTEEQDEHEELVTYTHICDGCSHQIANHEHLFRVEDEYQIYEMQCLLCGHGENQRSIMPVDPRGPKD